MCWVRGKNPAANWHTQRMVLEQASYHIACYVQSVPSTFRGDMGGSDWLLGMVGMLAWLPADRPACTELSLATHRPTGKEACT